MAKFAKKINLPHLPVNARRFLRGLAITARGAISTAMLSASVWWALGVHAQNGWHAVGRFLLAVLALIRTLVIIDYTGAQYRENRKERA